MTAYTFRVQVADGSAQAVELEQSVDVALGITGTLPNATENEFYAYSLHVGGGVPPYTWSISSGTLPPGLSIDPQSGVIYGEPGIGSPALVGSPNSFTFTIQVQDSSSPPQTATSTQTVAVNETVLSYSYFNPSDKGSSAVLADSNKSVQNSTGTSSVNRWARSVTAKTSGKWYVEFVYADPPPDSAADTIGVGCTVGSGSVGTYVGQTSAGWALWGKYQSGGNYTVARLYNNDAIADTQNVGAFYMATNSVMALLLDIDAGKGWFIRNPTSVTTGVFNAGNPVAGTSPCFTFTAGASVKLAADAFGQSSKITLRTDPAEMTAATFSGFTKGWPD